MNTKILVVLIFVNVGLVATFFVEKIFDANRRAAKLENRVSALERRQKLDEMELNYMSALAVTNTWTIGQLTLSHQDIAASVKRQVDFLISEDDRVNALQSCLSNLIVRINRGANR